MYRTISYIKRARVSGHYELLHHNKTYKPIQSKWQTVINDSNIYTQ